MSKIININLFLSTNTVCEEPRILNVFMIIGFIINVFKILIPIFLILISTISLVKVLFNKDEITLNTFSDLLIKITIGLLIFFIPSLIKASFVFINNQTKANLKSNCIKCLEAPNDCQTMVTSLKSLEETNLLNKKDYIDIIKESARKKQEEKLQEAGESVNEITTLPTTSDDPNNRVTTYGEAGDLPNGTVIGQKYHLTTAQLKFLAMIAQKEQGSLEGTKAEASLMANLFERKPEKNKAKYGSGGQGLYNYVLNSGWVSNTKKYLNNYGKLKKRSIDVVKDVLVGGNRTLPPYVTNHDCRNCYGICFNGIKGDICKLVLEGKKYETIKDIMNDNLYKKDKTYIYSRYGDGKSRWIFYSFPTPKSDPFGYYIGDYRRYKNSQN